MGRLFLAIGKTILAVVAVAGMVIASFYFAYLLLVLIVVAVVGTVAWFFFSREEKVQWYKYEDSD